MDREGDAVDKKRSNSTSHNLFCRHQIGGKIIAVGDSLVSSTMQLRKMSRSTSKVV